MKYLLSIVWKMVFVMSLLTILVISSAIPSLTPIETRRKTLCRSVFSWELLLFVIYGSAVLLMVLVQSETALDAISTSPFLMWIVDL